MVVIYLKNKNRHIFAKVEAVATNFAGMPPTPTPTLNPIDT